MLIPIHGHVKRFKQKNVQCQLLRWKTCVLCVAVVAAFCNNSSLCSCSTHMMLQKRHQQYKRTLAQNEMKKMARKSRTSSRPHNGWVNEHLLTHGNTFNWLWCVHLFRAFKCHSHTRMCGRCSRNLSIGRQAYMVGAVSFAGKSIESSKWSWPWVRCLASVAEKATWLQFDWQKKWIIAKVADSDSYLLLHRQRDGVCVRVCAKKLLSSDKSLPLHSMPFAIHGTYFQ